MMTLHGDQSFSIGGFYPVSNTSLCSRDPAQNRPVVCLFSFFFFLVGSSRICLLEDSARRSINPGDRACNRMRFLASVPKAPCGTGA